MKLKNYITEKIESDEIIIKVRDPEKNLIKLIHHIDRLSGPGHSFGVDVDQEAGRKNGWKTFGIDGDGSFHIRSLKLNGKEYKDAE